MGKPSKPRDEPDNVIGLTEEERTHLTTSVVMLDRISKRRGETRGTEPARLAISNIEGLFRWNANVTMKVVK